MRKISVALGALALAACNPVAQADGADALAETFHQDFSAGNFEKIWNEADEGFRQSTPRAEFDQAMPNLHRFYGAYQGGTREGININSENGVTTTEINMATTYANSRATETFTFRGTGEDMALFNWTIDPVRAGGATSGEEVDADNAGKPMAAEQE